MSKAARRETKIFVGMALFLALFLIFVFAQSHKDIERGKSNVYLGQNSGYSGVLAYNNTFLGGNSGYNNVGGYGNTALGFLADMASAELHNATAIGYNAVVAASDTLVLGGTGAYAVKVAIGQTTATEALDVVGNIKATGLIAGGPYVDVRTYDSFALAVAGIGATEATLLIPTQQAVTGDVTVPATLALKFLRGGSLSISSTKTVTINGSLDAGLYQVFEGDGSVSFGAGAVKEVYPEWWGENATPGTTDMTAEIQAAIDSYRAVSLVGTSYKITIALSITNDDSRIIFAPNTKLVITENIIGFNVTGTSYAVPIDNIIFENPTIEYAYGSGGAQKGIHAEYASNLKIIHPTILGSNCNGIELFYCRDFLIRDGFIDRPDSYPIFLYRSKDGEVKSNYLEQGARGIVIKGSYNSEVRSGIVIQSNWLKGQADYGIASGELVGEGYIEGVIISENVIRDLSATATGIYLATYTGDYEVNTNYLYDTGICGISMKGDGHKVIGNEINNLQAGSAAISLACTASVINSNIIDSGATNGIYLGDTTANIIGGNRIYNTVSHGIWINGNTKTPTYNIIHSNTITDCGGYAIYESGANGVHNRILNSGIVKDNTSTPAINVYSNITTFTVDDATPSVLNADVCKTANANATTITMFDDGYRGQKIMVIINDALTTIDFTGTNLKGNVGVDWTPASGDWLEATFDGTNWYCSVHDCTA